MRHTLLFQMSRNHYQATLKTYHKNYNESLKALRNIEKHATFHGFQFLQSKIIEAHQSDNPTKAKRFLAIYKSEVRREAFSKLTPLIKGTKNCPLRETGCQCGLSNKPCCLLEKAYDSLLTILISICPQTVSFSYAV